jgi:hypothetical protein
MDPSCFRHPLRFPLNVSGPFYTTGQLTSHHVDPNTPRRWCGNCLWCGAPEAEAPTLFAPFDESYKDTYFIRQPQTPEEIDQAVSAARVCCTYAVRYSGQDPEIIRKLDNSPEYCDFVLMENGALRCVVDEVGQLLPFAKQLIRKNRISLRQAFSRLLQKLWPFRT